MLSTLLSLMRKNMNLDNTFQQPDRFFFTCQYILTNFLRQTHERRHIEIGAGPWKKLMPTSRHIRPFVQDGKVLVIDEESVSAFARDFAGDSVVDEPFHC